LAHVIPGPLGATLVAAIQNRNKFDGAEAGNGENLYHGRRRFGVAYRPRQRVAGNREVIRDLNDASATSEWARDPIGTLNVVRHNPSFPSNFLPFPLDPHVT
jgi:hypothetical protein